jgi:predicted nucleotidyltransferase component of viral defense system
VSSGWHQAKTQIVSFEPEEIFGTKLRALLQRHKNRDLFDLNQGLLQLGLDCGRVIACFEHYLCHPERS